jgi:hypothetical protein
MNRRSFLKTNLFGAIGLAAMKIANTVSAARSKIDKCPAPAAGEVKTGGSRLIPIDGGIMFGPRNSATANSKC